MRNKQWRTNAYDISLRVLADLAVAHTVMLAALVVALQLQYTPDQSLPMRVALLREYYQRLFLPLSALFPLIYGLNGLYTQSRGEEIFAKLRRATTSAALAVLLMAAASLVWARTNALPRTAAVIFSLLMLLATPAIRLVKHWAFESEKRRHGVLQRGRLPVLVVGGAGYIGSIVVRKLLQRGRHVRVLDSLVYGDSALAGVRHHPHLEFIHGDCRNIQDVVSAMTDVGAVVHLAAIVGDPACDCDHKTAREVNYAATRMMIEIAKGKRVGRFVFASSCSVYGLSDRIMDETSEVCPISLYAETKVDSEKALLAVAAKDFSPTILRFSTIFGLSPRPRFDLVVNLLTAKAMQEGVVTIFNGEQWRPFLHVDDAAEAVVRVLDAPVEVVGGQVYNIGDDRLNYTLTGVAEKILEVFPDTRIEHLENSDRRNYRVSFDKVRQHFGFTCSRMLEEGIRELKDAFEQGMISDYLSPAYSNVKYLKKYGSPLQKDEVGVQVMAALSQKAVDRTAAA